MKVSQSGKCQELLKFLQVQSLKPSSALMKLALMRTATGKEEPELSLLQRISSLEVPASEIAAQINASRSSSNRRLLDVAGLANYYRLQREAQPRAAQ